MASVISAENTSRSTVSAWPPGTRALSAARIRRESSARISCFKKPGRGMDLFALQRITADEFAERIGLVRGRALVRTHFMKHNTCARFGCLKGGFASRKTGANNVDYFQIFKFRGWRFAKQLASLRTRGASLVPRSSIACIIL